MYPVNSSNSPDNLRRAASELASHLWRLPPAETLRLAEEASSAFHSKMASSGNYSRDDVALICAAATHPDRATAEAGSRIFFSRLVEPFSDAFDPALVAVCDQATAQATSFCAGLEESLALRDALARFGALDEESLLRRMTGLRSSVAPEPIKTDLRKVVLLSRVTWGADVAISSIFIARLRVLCPRAELVFLGSPDLTELFGGDPNLRLRPAPYPRQGTLLERLSQWPALVDVVEEETTGLAPSEWAVIDPESRLTQLGALPVVADESRYFLFPSRSYPKETAASLGHLAADWIDEACGEQHGPLPYVAPPSPHKARAAHLLQTLREHAIGPVVAVNFAVGANPQKRLGDAFEESLLRRVLALGTRVVLASGGETADVDRARRLAEGLAQDGVLVVTVSEADSAPGAAGAPSTSSGQRRLTKSASQVLAWKGSLGGFSALIAGSDAFLGYDSACTHIAAALGVPTIAIFGWYPNDTFVRRWTPYGPAPVRVVVARDKGPAGTEATANAALDALRRVLVGKLPRD